MTAPDEFRAALVEATQREGYRRATAGWRWRLRMVFVRYEGDRLDKGRWSRRALGAALSEAADRFTPLERRRFDLRGELPEWFWPWVEGRAAWWDREV